MPLEWSFSQNIELKNQSPDVAEGVCMVMSYYVCKRMLAGLETTPDLLRRKMPQFASGQRAGEWDVKLSTERWVEMLARRDNLQARVVQARTNFDEAMEAALGTVDLNAPPAFISLCLNLYWKSGEGHSVVMGFDMKNRTRVLFDANVGLVSVQSDADDDLMSREYDDASKIGCVVMWGTPRDMKFLAND